MAAGCANETRLNVGQPGVIRPAVNADRNRMTAAIVRAVDQQAANALGAQAKERQDLAIPVGRGLRPDYLSVFSDDVIGARRAALNLIDRFFKRFAGSNFKLQLAVSITLHHVKRRILNCHCYLFALV